MCTFLVPFVFVCDFVEGDEGREGESTSLALDATLLDAESYISS